MNQITVQNVEKLTTLERFISLFTKIRAGEGWAVGMYFLYAGLVVFSYYIFKTIREPLIIVSGSGSGSADAKAYATGLAAVVLLFFTPIYSQLFRHFSREKLVMSLALMFSLMGFIFAVLFSANIEIAYSYYVWVSVYGVMMVTQFWVFTTGSFNVKSGKRLFPVILIGASLGGLIGSKVAGDVISSMGLGSGLYIASAVIGFTAILPYIARRLVPEESMCITCDQIKPEKSNSLLGGISVVLNSKFMIFIAIYALLLNIINSTGEFLFAESLLSRAGELGLAGKEELERYIGSTYATFALWTTAITLLFQMFFVSRIIIKCGMTIAIMVMPVAITILYSIGGFFPVFSFIYVMKTIDNCLDYSITNTVRQTLFLPVSRKEKFEAKTAIDTLFWRTGDLIQAGVIFVALHWFDWGVKELALFCGVLGLVWIYFARKVALEYERRLKSQNKEAPKLNLPFDSVTVMPGRELNFRVPADTFITADPSDHLEYDAMLSNGNDLPSWLSFIKKPALFTGQVPELNNEIEIKLIAKDCSGLSTENIFSLKVAD